MTDNTLLRAAWNAGWNAANPEMPDVPQSFEEWLPAYDAMIGNENRPTFVGSGLDEQAVLAAMDASSDLTDRTNGKADECEYVQTVVVAYLNALPPTPPPAPEGEAVAWADDVALMWLGDERSAQAFVSNRKSEKFHTALYTHPTPPTVDGGLSYEQQADELTSAYQDTDARGEWPGSRFLLDALHASGFEIRRKI